MTMRAGLIYWRLQLKKFIKKMPVIMVESILFAVLILAFGIYAARAVYGENDFSKIKIAVVSQEESRMTNMLLSFVGGMESFEDSCEFLLMEEEEAGKAAEKGEIYAAVFLPEGVLESILDGTNVPARIVLNHAYSRMEAEIFEAAAQAGNRLLSVAQAGIYAADEFCLMTGQEELIPDAEEKLNEAYLEYALGRNAVFKMQEITATGKAGPAAYYSIALFLVFLSFAGMILARYAQVRKNVFSRLLSAKGLWAGWQYLAESMAFAAVYAIFGTVLGVFVLLFAMHAENKGRPEITGILVLFLGIFVMGTFLRLLVEVTGHETGGIGIGLGIQSVMVIICGLILPPAFLPPTLEKVGTFLPHTIWLQSLLAVLNGQEQGVWIAGLGLVLAGSLVCGMLLFACPDRREIGRAKAEAGREKGAISDWGKGKDVTAVWGIVLKQYLIRHRAWYAMVLGTCIFLFLAGDRLAQEEMTGIKVGVCAEDEDGRRLLERMQMQEGVFRFEAFKEKEEMLREIENGSLECGYVFEEGFYEKLCAGKRNRLIELYYSPGSSIYKLSYEIVFSHLFALLSEEILENWYEESGISVKNGKTELLQLKEKYETNGSTFSFVYEKKGEGQLERETVLDPIRGFIAVVMFFLGLLGLGNSCTLREKFSAYLGESAVSIGRRSLIVSIAGAVGSGLLMLITSGRFQITDLGRELLGLIAFAGILLVFCLLLQLILSSADRIYAALPVLLLGTLLFCPVFIRIKTYIPAVAFIEKIFPVSWYLYFFM